MKKKLILGSMIIMFFCSPAAFGVTSIIFTFANGQIIGTDTKYYEFDVMAAAGESGTRVGDYMAYINYNTEGFGLSIVAHNKITVSKGALIQGEKEEAELYSTIVADNTASRVAITALYNFESNPNWGNELSISPTPLVHIKIEIADQSETAGLSFQQNLMNGSQYQSNMESYSPVYANDSDDSSLPVELSSFTASADDTKVTLKWETGSEVGNIGFYVYRSETADGPFKKISELVEGAGNSALGRTYEYIDKKVEPNKTYFYYLEDIDVQGVRNRSDTIQVTVPLPKKPPEETRLFQNYPNPFNPETWIPFQLAEPADVTLYIYNVLGQLIRTLLLGQQNTGFYVNPSKTAYWDGKNASGEKVASGLYFYELRTEKFRAVRKMVLLK